MYARENKYQHCKPSKLGKPEKQSNSNIIYILSQSRPSKPNMIVKICKSCKNIKPSKLRKQELKVFL